MAQNPLTKLNLHQAMCRALEQRGERRVDARTHKYAVYTRSYAGRRDAEGKLIPIARQNGEDVFWYVGKSGALRIGKKTTGSHPVIEQVKHALVTEGRT